MTQSGFIKKMLFSVTLYVLDVLDGTSDDVCTFFVEKTIGS